MRPIVFLIICCLAISSCSEDESSINPGDLSYFPLQLGNRWEYEPIRKDVPLLGSVTYTIVSDVNIEGRQYFGMERYYRGGDGHSSRDTVYYRTDDQGNVFELSRYAPVERNRFRLGAVEGDTWLMDDGGLPEDYVVTTTITDVTLSNGVLQNCNSFYYNVPIMADEEHYLVLAQGIGIVKHGNAWGFDYRLKSAYVGGVDY